MVLHDSSRYAPRDSAAPTVEAVAMVAEAARVRDLRLRSVEESLTKG